MDTETIIRFLLALTLVVMMMAGLAALFKYLSNSRFSAGVKGKRRLDVIESLALDHKRRAIILARDDVEHLIILGPDSEIVVETNISAPDNLAPIQKRENLKPF